MVPPAGSQHRVTVKRRGSKRYAAPAESSSRPDREDALHSADAPSADPAHDDHTPVRAK
jgi:hypothetical protein